MKIVIATGGTGGHLFPAIRVAKALEQKGCSVMLMGSFRRGVEHVASSGLVYTDIDAQGLSMSLKGLISSVWTMMKAMQKSWALLRQNRPQLVIGFGGYGAFPVVFSAILLRCPTMIHEQNVIPGRANAVLAHFVTKIAVSFRESLKYFKKKKTLITGCPCHMPRAELNRSEIYKQFQLVQSKKTVLVLGGSQGSRRINEEVMKAVKVLRARDDVQIMHVCGKQDFAMLQKQYKEIGISFALFEFLDKMVEAYTIADFVITRAGAVTVCEIAHFGIPAIFIPYPYAQGHQKANASLLCREGYAQMIEEKDLTSDRLSTAMRDRLDRLPNHKGAGQYRSEICVDDTVKRLVDEALKIAR